MSTSTSLPPSALAVAIINRLERDLTELQRAVSGVDLLPADEQGQLFDAECHLAGAIAALQKGIACLHAYAGDRPAPPALSPERQAKLRAAAAATDALNECIT